MDSNQLDILDIFGTKIKHFVKDGKLFKIIAKIQEGVEPIQRNTENKFTKKNYADLQAVVDAIDFALDENDRKELLYTGSFIPHSSGLYFMVEISNELGEYIRSTVQVPEDIAKEAQKLGAFQTYMKRYGLSGIFYLLVDNDDDGEGTKNKQKKNSNPVDRNDNQPKINFKELMDKVKQEKNLDNLKTLWNTNYDAIRLQLSDKEYNDLKKSFFERKDLLSMNAK